MYVSDFYGGYFYKYRKIIYVYYDELIKFKSIVYIYIKDSSVIDILIFYFV